MVDLSFSSNRFIENIVFLNEIDKLENLRVPTDSHQSRSRIIWFARKPIRSKGSAKSVSMIECLLPGCYTKCQVVQNNHNFLKDLDVQGCGIPDVSYTAEKRVWRDHRSIPKLNPLEDPNKKETLFGHAPTPRGSNLFILDPILIISWRRSAEKVRDGFVMFCVFGWLLMPEISPAWVHSSPKPYVERGEPFWYIRHCFNTYIYICRPFGRNCFFVGTL